MGVSVDGDPENVVVRPMKGARPDLAWLSDRPELATPHVEMARVIGKA